jgi:hypothetical protein
MEIPAAIGEDERSAETILQADNLAKAYDDELVVDAIPENDARNIYGNSTEFRSSRI